MNASFEGDSSRVGSAGRSHRFAESFAIGFLVFIVSLSSSARLPLTWDEGDAFYRAENVAAWASALRYGAESRRASSAEEKEKVQTGPVEDYRRAAASYFGSLENRFALFSEEALLAGFPHTIVREGHPAGYSIALALGKNWTDSARAFISEKQGYRFVGVLLFSLALACVYARVSRSFGRWSGLGATFFILCSPRIFAHAQIAGGDSLLISSWLFAWLLFERALRGKRGATLWGLALGLSFSAKFSGFLLVAPFAFVLAFELFDRSLSFRDRRALLVRFALGVCVGLGTFFALNPPLWRDPFGGFARFCELNMTREGFNIPIYFFGEFYTPSRPLPWWNGFFWVFATIPLPIVLASFWTLARRYVLGHEPIYRDREEERSMKRLFATALALGLTLPLTRVLPGLPVHDGARLLIASCSFWGVLAGLAFAPLSRPFASRRSFFQFRFRVFGRRADVSSEFFDPRVPSQLGLDPREARKASRRSRCRRATLVAYFLLASIVGAVDLWTFAPRYLSFYNAALGGVSGAFRRGLEPTYYWDAFDGEAVCFLHSEFLRRSHEEQEEGKRKRRGVLFSAFSAQTLSYYRQWKTLGLAELATTTNPESLADLDRYDFYVLQIRPSGFSQLDATLVEYAEPVGRGYARDAFSFGANKKDPVVVLEIYDIADVKLALETLSGKSTL